MGKCYHCGNIIDPKLRIYRNTLCPVCSGELKICKNCTFYSPGSHWDCRETIREPVKDKEKANFCDFFIFSASSASLSDQDDGSADQKKEKARSNFDKLFGNE